VATVKAATDLYGATSAETNAVKAAWTAVLVKNTTSDD
jgi:Zn-dependent metalloprotease